MMSVLIHYEYGTWYDYTGVGAPAPSQTRNYFYFHLYYFSEAKILLVHCTIEPLFVVH